MTVTQLSQLKAMRHTSYMCYTYFVLHQLTEVAIAIFQMQNQSSFVALIAAVAMS